MSAEKHEYREECPDCRLVVCNTSGRKLGADHPHQIKAGIVWDASPLEERQACNRVWVHNSRDARDLELMSRLAARVEKAIRD